MAKTGERKTAANVIYYYTFGDLSTHAELDPWFSDFLACTAKSAQITRIRLDNLFSRHSEDDGPVEMDVTEARNGVLQAMRNSHANRLDVYLTYRDAQIVLGLTLGNWEVSLSAGRRDADKLTELAELLNFEKAKPEGDSP